MSGAVVMRAMACSFGNRAHAYAACSGPDVSTLTPPRIIFHAMSIARAVPLLLALSGCGKSADRASAACGLATLAGPTALLTQFSIPRQTLSAPPGRLPERLVARVVAGPALPAIVGRADSQLIIGVEGAVPPTIRPGYGVLVVDPAETSRGVMLFEGMPVEGAPPIGTVTVGAATLPLIGIQLDPSRIEDPRCPFFPDSVLP
jgi:hypothetical protein